MEKAFQTINRAIEWMLVIIFGLLVLDVLWQVASRFLLGAPSSFTEEFARFAMIWMAILGAAYLNGQRGHLSIDYFIEKLSPEKRARREKLLEVFIMLFVLVVLVIGGFHLVYITLHLGQMSSALQIPLGYIYAIVPISGLIMIFFSIYHLSKKI